jgi:hypothetical protein
VRRLGCLRVALLLVSATLSVLCLATNALAQVKAADSPTLQDYAGTWVLKVDGKNFCVLRLELANGHLTGSLATPDHFQIDQGGEFSGISSTHRDNPILEASVVEGNLQIKAGLASGSAEYVLRLTDHDHVLFQMRIGSSLTSPWKLLRVSDSEKATVASNWDTTKYPEDIVELQSRLGEIVNEDQAVRNEVPMLGSKLRQVDESHYPEILRIYEKYKWPLISVVGRTAAHNYWLLVQHQPAEFQQRVLPDMQRAVEAGEASKIDYAYLYDRVMFQQGKPQHWGTQASCTNGKAVLAPVDDPTGLEQRRRDLQLMPVAIDEYLKVLDPFCSKFVNDPPSRSLDLNGIVQPLKPRTKGQLGLILPLTSIGSSAQRTLW